MEASHERRQVARKDSDACHSSEGLALNRASSQSAPPLGKTLPHCCVAAPAEVPTPHACSSDDAYAQDPGSPGRGPPSVSV